MVTAHYAMKYMTEAKIEALQKDLIEMGVTTCETLEIPMELLRDYAIHDHPAVVGILEDVIDNIPVIKNKIDTSFYEGINNLMQYFVEYDDPKDMIKYNPEDINEQEFDELNEIVRTVSTILEGRGLLGSPRNKARIIWPYMSSNLEKQEDGSYLWHIVYSRCADMNYPEDTELM